MGKTRKEVVKALYLSTQENFHSFLKLQNPGSPPASAQKTQSSGRKRYQLHLWIGQRDYATLKAMAREEDEPMARIVRRLIRSLQTQG